MAEASVAPKEAQIIKNRVAQLGPVMATLEVVHVEGDRRALPEARDEIQEALVTRRPATLMHPVEERDARIEALQKALEATLAKYYGERPGGGESAESSGFGDPSGCFQTRVDWRASSGDGAVADRFDAGCFHGAPEER